MPDEGNGVKAMEKNANILKRFLNLNGCTVIRIPARTVKASRLNVVIRSA
jgi:hypothetical protein